MNLISLLLRASWLTVAIALFTGLLSGASSAWLIALICPVYVVARQKLKRLLK